MQGTAQDSTPMNRLHNFDIVYKSHDAALKSEDLTKHFQILFG